MKDLRSNALVAVLFLFGLYLLLQPEGTATLSSRTPVVISEPQIDQHLKSSRFAEELVKEKTAVENALSAPIPDPARVDPLVYSKEKEPIPIILDGDDSSERIYRENNPADPSQRYFSLTPEQRIIKKVNRDRFAQEYQKQQEEVFMRQYIENARQAGYELKFNSKGEVIGYVEIGTDEPMRFPQSVPKQPAESQSKSGR